MAISAQDLAHLRSAVALAREALEAGDDPFGSLIVAADGTVLRTARNRAGSGDETQHPELELAQWSAELSPDDRAGCTVYTSGEHCPMCSAAHAWMGLGRIVFAGASEQLAAWRTSWGLPPGPVAVLPISVVAPALPVDGPAPELEEELRALHRAAYERTQVS